MGSLTCPLPEMGQTFDYVVAFSVFTNTTESDMLQLVNELLGVLSGDGALAFTFIDPSFLPGGLSMGGTKQYVL